jgi:four helix bundle protein
MLRVQVLVLDMIRKMQPVFGVLARKDPSLHDQLRRAAASVALNLAEGFGSSGGNKKLRYRTALGSLREVHMCLEVAVALGYLAAIDSELARQVHDATAMIVGLAR